MKYIEDTRQIVHLQQQQQQQSDREIGIEHTVLHSIRYGTAYICVCVRIYVCIPHGDYVLRACACVQPRAKERRDK